MVKFNRPPLGLTFPPSSVRLAVGTLRYARGKGDLMMF